MNLKTTLETLRRIERLLDGWQSSGDIPAIERDLACDLLRRAYDDILFSDNYVAAMSEASLAENTPADRMNEKAVGEVADTLVDAAAAAGDTLNNVDVVSPVGLAGLASSEEPTEGIHEELPENTEAIVEPAAENVSIEEPAAGPAEEDAPVETPVEESIEGPVSVEESVPAEESVEEPAYAEESVSAEESVPVGKPVEDPASVENPTEENIPIGTSAAVPVEEDAPIEAPAGEVAEEEIPVEEFEVFGAAGGAVEEPGDAVSSAEVVATSIPETSADVVIDPVFEVFTDEDEDAEESDGTEESEDAEAVDLAGAVNVVEAVEAVGAAEDTEIAEEKEAVKETEAEEREIERPIAASSAIGSVAATVEPAVESEPESVSAPASAGTSAEETPADATASNVETLEEMAARFKNASGRRRKSRRAFLSLYDEDEMARSGKRNDQLELSDWGVEPSDTSSKLRHTRELFGLPVDDLETTLEPTPQPADKPATESAAVAESVDVADATDDEIEIVDFVGDDDPMQSDRGAKSAAEPLIKSATEPTPEPRFEPTAAPTQPTPRPAVAPTREGLNEAEDDLPFDEAVVALEEVDDIRSAVPHLEPLGSSEQSGSSEYSEASDTEPFDSIEIVEIADEDDETHEIEEDEIQHTDRAEVVDEPVRSGATAPAIPATPTASATSAASTTSPTSPTSPTAPTAPTSATEPAVVRGLYGREEKPEMPSSTPVLGEVMGHDAPTVGDSLGHRPDVAGWAEVSEDLNRAISVGERFVLLRDLFDGDQALCDRTLKRLSTFDDLDDCMIWITENFAWNANSEGAKLIMGLLERKLG